MAIHVSRLRGPWVRFCDTHSGGNYKFGRYQRVYIQGSVNHAKDVFKRVLHRDPNHHSCECLSCREDFEAEAFASLSAATAADREGDVKDPQAGAHLWEYIERMGGAPGRRPTPWAVFILADDTPIFPLKEILEGDKDKDEDEDEEDEDEEEGE